MAVGTGADIVGGLMFGVVGQVGCIGLALYYAIKANQLGKRNQDVAEGKSDYKIKSIGTDAKGDYYISPSTGKKVYKSGVKKGDHENPKTGEHKGVNEERTETKDKEGNVIGWEDGTDWKKSKGKDPRGKVTNLSDKARRETEKAEKEKVKEGNDDLARILTIMNHRR
jgi:hypothetical protein